MQGNICKGLRSGWTGLGLLQGQKGLLEPYVFVYAAIRHYSLCICNRTVGEETWGPSLADRPPNTKLPISLLPYAVGFKVHKRYYFVTIYWTVGSKILLSN